MTTRKRKLNRKSQRTSDGSYRFADGTLDLNRTAKEREEKENSQYYNNGKTTRLNEVTITARTKNRHSDGSPVINHAKSDMRSDEDVSRETNDMNSYSVRHKNDDPRKRISTEELVTTMNKGKNAFAQNTAKAALSAYGIGALGAGLAAAPLATGLSLAGGIGGGKLVDDATKRRTGKTWDEYVESKGLIPQGWGDWTNPGYIIGGHTGAKVGAKATPYVKQIGKDIARGYSIIKNGMQPELAAVTPDGRRVNINWEYNPNETSMSATKSAKKRARRSANNTNNTTKNNTTETKNLPATTPGTEVTPTQSTEVATRNTNTGVKRNTELDRYTEVGKANNTQKRQQKRINQEGQNNTQNNQNSYNEPLRLENQPEYAEFEELPLNSRKGTKLTEEEKAARAATRERNKQAKEEQLRKELDDAYIAAYDKGYAEDMSNLSDDELKNIINHKTINASDAKGYSRNGRSYGRSVKAHETLNGRYQKTAKDNGKSIYTDYDGNELYVSDKRVRPSYNHDDAVAARKKAMRNGASEYPVRPGEYVAINIQPSENVIGINKSADPVRTISGAIGEHINSAISSVKNGTLKVIDSPGNLYNNLKYRVNHSPYRVRTKNGIREVYDSTNPNRVINGNNPPTTGGNTVSNPPTTGGETPTTNTRSKWNLPMRLWDATPKSIKTTAGLGVTGYGLVKGYNWLWGDKLNSNNNESNNAASYGNANNQTITDNDNKNATVSNNNNIYDDQDLVYTNANRDTALIIPVGTNTTDADTLINGVVHPNKNKKFGGRKYTNGGTIKNSRTKYAMGGRIIARRGTRRQNNVKSNLSIESINPLNKYFNIPYINNDREYLINKYKNKIDVNTKLNNKDLKLLPVRNYTRRQLRQMRRELLREESATHYNNTVNDVIGLASNGIGAGISYAITNRALNKMKPNSRPAIIPAVKLKTNYNINPQLSEINNETNNIIRETNANTASSAVANAKNQNVRLAAINAKNKLYGDKENKETELINADKLNQQNVIKANIEKYNDWQNNVTKFNNDIFEQKANNSVSLVNNINSGVQDFLTRDEKRERDDKNLLASVLPTIVSGSVNPDLYADTGLIKKNSPLYNNLSTAYRKPKYSYDIKPFNHNSNTNFYDPNDPLGYNKRNKYKSLIPNNK